MALSSTSAFSFRVMLGVTKSQKNKKDAAKEENDFTVSPGLSFLLEFHVGKSFPFYRYKENEIQST